MKVLKVCILLFIVSFIISIAYSISDSLSTPPFYLGGIQINEPDQHKWSETLQDIGMNTASVTVYAKQGPWDSNTFWWREEPYVIKEIKAAKAAGLKVILIPRVALDHSFEENAFLWHGMIGPTADTILIDWFNRYEQFLSYWAQIAEIYEIDVMAIGSELRLLSATQPVEELPVTAAYFLNDDKQRQYMDDVLGFRDQIPIEALSIKADSLNYESLSTFLEAQVKAKKAWAHQVTYADQTDTIAAINQHRQLLLKQWYRIIDMMRKTYSGKLTYAANFDNYQNVKFWDKLDFIGINAYFQLRAVDTISNKESQYLEMEQSWERTFHELDSFRTQHQLLQQTIFTELGYINRVDCTIMPWKGFGFSIGASQRTHTKKLFVWKNQQQNQTERALAVKALHQVNKKYQVLDGILYWKFTTQDAQLAIEPFAMQLNSTPLDPLQKSLLLFLDNE